MMDLPGPMDEESAAAPLVPVLPLLLGETAVEDDAQIIVGMAVRRNAIVAAMRGEGQQLAAGGTRRDHVVRHTEPQGMGVVGHGR